MQFPFRVRDIEGNTRRFASLSKAIDFARKQASACWRVNATWSVFQPSEPSRRWIVSETGTVVFRMDGALA